MTEETALASEAARGRIRDHLRFGDAVPEDLIAAWREARAADFDRLARLPREEARRALSRETHALEAELVSAEEGQRRDPAAQLGAVLDLGEKARWLIWLARSLAAQPARDPLASIENEIRWVETSARAMRRWDPRLETAADGVLARAKELEEQLLCLRSERFVGTPRAESNSPALPDPLAEAFALWTAAGEAFSLAVQIECRPAARPERVPILERREEHLDACRAAVDRLDAAGKSRFSLAVAAELLDQGSADLSAGADGGSGDRAGDRVAGRLPTLRCLHGRIDAFFAILGGARRTLQDERALSGDERARVRRDFLRLKKLRRRVFVAEREAEANARLERLFGPRRVKLFETFILFSILGFLALIWIEWRLQENSPWLPALRWVDLGLCIVFQVDFLVRWGCARWRGWFFLRHFFLESLPALPFGFFMDQLGQARGAGAIEELRALVAVRVLRFQRVILLGVRSFRLLVLLVRGKDRVVERFRWLLDRDICIFEPTAASVASDTPIAPSIAPPIDAVEERRRRAVWHLHAATPWQERLAALGAHLRSLDAEARCAAGLRLPYAPRAAASAGEVHVEHAIHHLLDFDPCQALALLGPDGVLRAARWLRRLDVPPVRWLPLVRRFAVASREAEPAEAVSAAAQTLGEMLQTVLGCFRFTGDLSGISTGPQVLDRVATAIMVATKGPAVRLLLIGMLFLAFEAVAQLVDRWILDTNLLSKIGNPLETVLGLPLLILGSVCLLILLSGRWLKRIAGEALDIYLRTADAHFYPLLKGWKRDRARQDIELLHRRVFAPEEKLHAADSPAAGNGGAEAWLAEAVAAGGALGGSARGGAHSRGGDSMGSTRPPVGIHEEDRELVVLLYRDFLDGPILHYDDTKTSVQLLGNLLLGDLRARTLRLTQKERRRLERLDLDRRRALAFGPYFWFRFITESLAIETAKLLLEYNTSCIPIDQLSLAPPEARGRFERFLAARRVPWHVAERRSARALQSAGEPLSTSEFTALHFLAASPERDDRIRRRFGGDVLAALLRDRRGMVRDIFGTRPYHLLPRGQRVFNPYRFFHHHLAGLRVLLLPLRLVWGTGKLVFLGLGQLRRLVREVLGKEDPLAGPASRIAGFDAAVRKINRMRKPYFMEAMRLRAAVDIDYLGLRLPGFERRDDGPTFMEDLDSIGALENERRPLRALRQSALRDLRRLRNFLAARLGSPAAWDALLERIDPRKELSDHRGEVVRAIVADFLTDHDGVRSLLTAPDEAREIVERCLRTRESRTVRLGSFLWAAIGGLLPARQRRQALFARYLSRSAEFESIPARAHRRMLRLLLRFGEESVFRRAVELKERAGGAEAAILEGLQRAARNHRSWTRQVIAVRAMQAITVLDIQSYRDLIWSVGGFEEDEGR